MSLATKVAVIFFVSLIINISYVCQKAFATTTDNNNVKQATTNTKRHYQVVKSDNNILKTSSGISNKFSYEPQLNKDKYVYVIQLNELSLGQDPQSAKAILNAKRNRRATNSVKSSSMTKQINKIDTEQQTFLQQASAQIPGLTPISRFKYGINGLAVKVTQAQAQKLANLPQVKRIQRQQTRRLHTDRGPTLVGAAEVWNGTAVANIEQTQGEGVIIAILDSGINSNHPSFAEVAGDGYLHANPLGNGVYLGDCAGNFASMCNNKLIGVYSYPSITNSYSDTSVFPPNLPRNGEDYGGHGSHVASIAAGNTLNNVEEVYPTEGEERSTGTTTGFVFTQISGVAPRANIISYQVCYGGTDEREDTYADCVDSAILQAIDDAIDDNVDIINFSISGGGEPWSDITEQAFLSARNAGIFVATSAGNDGSQPSTSEKNAPWYTSVAASEHGRENVFLKEINNFTGGASTLGSVVGQSNTSGIVGSIVYAGDFNNSNDPNGDSAQCLEPFPAGTFNGQIVVCDRGDIARIQKAINVRDGGAGGYILANVSTGESFLANDQYVIPGIHINEDNGDRLKAWLATGQNHRGTITTGVPSQFIDEERVDVIAEYSSRGPNLSFNMLVPTLTAPGTAIFGAYADEQLGHDGHEPAASNFDTLQGTSMSSPHVAGAAALIKSVNPTWNADEIRSALALTATTLMKKEDAISDATFFDMGSGRIQVNKAIASPLVMSETAANYNNANPAFGGDPRNLNLPSITDTECTVSCSWSRTFTATVDASFAFDSITMDSGLQIEALPANFSLLKGQTQTVVFTIDSTQASKIEYSFALARFTSAGLPDVNLPISIVSTFGNIPQSVVFDGRRASDTTLIKDIEAIDVNNFVLTTYLPVRATVVNGSISEDTSNNDYLDDETDGVSITRVTVLENARRLVTKIKSSSASDLDLFVLFDENENGTPERSEEIARSISGNSFEEISINYPNAGSYFIIVQNYTSSQAPSDSFDLRYGIVSDQVTQDSLTVIAPSALNAAEPFDMRFSYNLPESNSGDDYYAAVAMGTSQGLEDLGLINVDINRVDNDVFVSGSSARLDAGDSASLTVTVKSNPTNEARNYTISLQAPNGTEITSFSTSNDGQLTNGLLTWQVEQAAGSTSDTVLDFTMLMLTGIQTGTVPIIVNSTLSTPIQSDSESGDTFTGIQISGPIVVDSGGSSGGSGSLWLFLLLPIAFIRLYPLTKTLMH